jgi:hypothetical protein
MSDAVNIKGCNDMNIGRFGGIYIHFRGLIVKLNKKPAEAGDK